MPSMSPSKQHRPCSVAPIDIGAEMRAWRAQRLISATTVQSIWRRAAARRLVCMKNRAIGVLQRAEHRRGRRRRQKIRQQQAAAAAVQSTVRGRRVRLQLREAQQPAHVNPGPDGQTEEAPTRTVMATEAAREAQAVAAQEEEEQMQDPGWSVSSTIAAHACVPAAEFERQSAVNGAYMTGEQVGGERSANAAVATQAMATATARVGDPQDVSSQALTCRTAAEDAAKTAPEVAWKITEAAPEAAVAVEAAEEGAALAPEAEATATTTLETVAVGVVSEAAAETEARTAAGLEAEAVQGRGQRSGHVECACQAGAEATPAIAVEAEVVAQEGVSAMAEADVTVVTEVAIMAGAKVAVAAANGTGTTSDREAELPERAAMSTLAEPEASVAPRCEAARVQATTEAEAATAQAWAVAAVARTDVPETAPMVVTSRVIKTEQEAEVKKAELDSRGVLRVRLERVEGIKTMQDGAPTASIRLQLGRFIRRSSVATSTFNPTWYEVFEFCGELRQLLAEVLKLRVCNNDTAAGSETIGDAHLELSSLLTTRAIRSSLPITLGSSAPVGTLFLEVSWAVGEAVGERAHSPARSPTQSPTQMCATQTSGISRSPFHQSPSKAPFSGASCQLSTRYVHSPESPTILEHKRTVPAAPASVQSSAGAPAGSPTTNPPNSGAPTTSAPNTSAPTTSAPTTSAPNTGVPTTSAPTTSAPTGSPAKWTMSPAEAALASACGAPSTNTPAAVIVQCTRVSRDGRPASSTAMKMADAQIVNEMPDAEIVYDVMDYSNGFPRAHSCALGEGAASFVKASLHREEEEDGAAVLRSGNSCDELASQDTIELVDDASHRVSGFLPRRRTTTISAMLKKSKLPNTIVPTTLPKMPTLAKSPLHLTPLRRCRGAKHSATQSQSEKDGKSAELKHN